MTIHGIDLDSQAIRDLCARCRIKELTVFGSIFSDDFRPDSDVDFLVIYDQDADWDLSDHVEIQEELARIVGRPVDLLSRCAVNADPNWLFRRSVMSRTERVCLQ